jgi:hypothetical protein
MMTAAEHRNRGRASIWVSNWAKSRCGSLVPDDHLPHLGKIQPRGVVAFSMDIASVKLWPVASSCI